MPMVMSEPLHFDRISQPEAFFSGKILWFCTSSKRSGPLLSMTILVGLVLLAALRFFT
jgi:hypothetical protein